MCYYAVCKDVSSLNEIEEMENNLILTSFKKLKFVDCNKMLFKKLMYKAFKTAEKKCNKWNDYQMKAKSFDKMN